MQSQTMVSTTVQGQDITVGLRDKTNWEKHTTPEQRNDPNFNTTFSDGLKEKAKGTPVKAPEPVKEEPKEEIKEIPIPEKIEEPRIDPTGSNYRIEAKRAMLEQQMAGDQEIIDELGNSRDTNQKVFLAKAKIGLAQARSNIEKLEANDKKLGLPHIPMGKNTHKKATQGFVHSSKTKILVDEKIKMSLPTRINFERIKSAWNNLPDNVRDDIGILNLKKSRAKGSGFQGGRWTDEKAQLTMNLNDWSSNPLHDFYHEVGHSRFANIKRREPEKIKKFIEAQKEIGSSPTRYSQSFSVVHITEVDRMNRFVQRQKRRGMPISPRSQRNMEKNLEMVKDLYQDETHAELNAIAMGEMPEHLITANKKNMTDLLNAYKELHNL